MEIRCNENGRFHHRDDSMQLCLGIWQSSPTNFSAHINGEIKWFRTAKLAEKWLESKYKDYIESKKCN